MENKTRFMVGMMKPTKLDFITKISLSKKDLELMESFLNDKGYVFLNAIKLKEPGKYGQSHRLEIDTWKPKPQAPKPETLTF